VCFGQRTGSRIFIGGSDASVTVEVHEFTRTRQVYHPGVVVVNQLHFLVGRIIFGHFVHTVVEAVGFEHHQLVERPADNLAVEIEAVRALLKTVPVARKIEFHTPLHGCFAENIGYELQFNSLIGNGHTVLPLEIEVLCVSRQGDAVQLAFGVAVIIVQIDFKAIV